MAAPVMVDSYIGRFAPSPSGPLHFGSLLTALASYLDARASGGKWLVRIEDIDPPREIIGAADTILLQLDAHGLYWDGEVVYQSQRLTAYDAAIRTLAAAGLTYFCDCSRARIQSLNGRYDGKCRHRAPTSSRIATGVATRIRADNLPSFHFTDIFQGLQRPRADGEETGDFVLRRRDQLMSYQLAVSVDDAAQQITHVIRGSDLITSTPQQLLILAALEQRAPQYGHIPLVVDVAGRKLSKQNGAAALDTHHPGRNLHAALRCLNQNPPLQLTTASAPVVLSWAIAHWQRQLVPKYLTVTQLHL